MFKKNICCTYNLVNSVQVFFVNAMNARMTQVQSRSLTNIAITQLYIF